MRTSHDTAFPAPPSLIDLESLALTLVGAYRERTLIDAPSRTLAQFSKGDALAVAERVRSLRIGAGETPVGYKVGFTNGAVRAQFDAEAQLAATVYEETLAAKPRIDARSLLGPRIEPEVVVGLGPDGHVAWAALGFEIVQSHVADWKFGYLDAIADFGLHAALVVGEQRAVTSRELEALSAMQVRLLRNGAVVEHGASADVDGGPLGSLAWLRDDLRRVGRELQPGELVSTGSMTRVPAIAAGERWTLEALGGELPALAIDID
jgi:2-oxo-3-hexenedioate decarboxylase